MAGRILLLIAFMALTSCAAQRIPSADATVTYGGNEPALTPETRANDAAPNIQAVWISGKTFSGGDLVRIRVIGSTNVAIVEMRTFSYGRALIKRDFGKFGCAYHVPVLPPFARFPYKIAFHFIARNSAGTPILEDASINVR